MPSLAWTSVSQFANPPCSLVVSIEYRVWSAVRIITSPKSSFITHHLAVSDCAEMPGLFVGCLAPWPMSVLLSRDAVEKYNRIMLLLIRLKMLSSRLNAVHAHVKHLCGGKWFRTFAYVVICGLSFCFPPYLSLFDRYRW